MSEQAIFVDIICGIVLAVGVARIGSALDTWPAVFPDGPTERDHLARQLAARVGRLAHASGWITAALVGMLRDSAAIVQLPLWGALAALAWATRGFPWYSESIASDAVERTSKYVKWAQAFTVVAALAAVPVALVNLTAGIWPVALAALLFALVRIDALVHDAASEVLSLRSMPTEPLLTTPAAAR